MAEFVITAGAARRARASATRAWMRCAGAAALVLASAGCSDSGSAALDSDGQPLVSDAQIHSAVAQLDGLAADMMRRSGIPGMAVAVVRGDAVLYAKGFGVRRAGSPEAVDADTVFALASMSKPIGATVVAQQVSLGRVRWDTPLRDVLPWFALSDPAASAQVTVGDMYAHRSGLPNHAGDSLEELGFDRDAILQRLRQLPLAAFRNCSEYTNYGMTGAAMAVAARAGTDWATLSEETLYKPLGMASTSSRFADFLARANRAPGHVKEQGAFVLGPERPAGTGEQRWSAAWNTDPQSPSGGVSSSVNDMARWMSFMLGAVNGTGAGAKLVSASALSPMVTSQALICGKDQKPIESPVSYGFGFFVETPEAGRRVLSHGGAYSWGTGTNVSMMPSANVGIVVLTKAWPTGVAEALSAQFLDLVQNGTASRDSDWYASYAAEFAKAFAPVGALAGKTPPVQPVPPQPLDSYAGSYENPYHGTAQVLRTAQGLELRLGPQGQTAFPLQHWDADLFVFTPLNDSAGPGSRSKADFSGGRLVLEHYDRQGLGVFARVP